MISKFFLTRSNPALKFASRTFTYQNFHSKRDQNGKFVRDPNSALNYKAMQKQREQKQRQAANAWKTAAQPKDATAVPKVEKKDVPLVEPKVKKVVKTDQTEKKQEKKDETNKNAGGQGSGSGGPQQPSNYKMWMTFALMAGLFVGDVMSHNDDSTNIAYRQGELV